MADLSPAVLARWDHQPAPPVAGKVGETAIVRRMCEIILGNTFGNEELDSLALLIGHHPDVLNASTVPVSAPLPVATGMPPMLEPTTPCCEAWISWAAEAAWYALDDDPSILVMPHAAGTRHRFNFCPSCGAERRSAVMKDPTA